MESKQKDKVSRSDHQQQQPGDKPDRPEPQNPNKIVTRNIEFAGRIIEVNSGDSVTIQSLKNEGKTGKFTFTNVRAPQIQRNSMKPYAWEAKEFLRKMLIGREVKVLYEYDKTFKRQVHRWNEKDDDIKEFEEEVTMQFATVFFEEKNVGALVLEKGLAELNRPRYLNETSKFLEELDACFTSAKKAKLNLHCEGKVYNAPRYNDISRSKNIQQAREALQFLKEHKRLTGVVELVLSGSRMKVRINEQNCMIILLLQGVRCLPNDANMSGYEEWSNKALKYSKEALTQRDAEFVIDSVDKKGCFHGSIFLQKNNDFAAQLLQQGLTVVFDKCRFTQEYEKLEAEAREKKVGIWGAANINLEKVRGGDFSEELRVVKQINETHNNLSLSDIISAGEFYMQNQASPVLKQIGEELEQIDPDKYPKLTPPIKKGTPCLAVFSADGLFYRAIVEKSSSTLQQSQQGKGAKQPKGKCLVQFMDYGNYEEVDVEDMRKLPEKFQKLEPQALRCSLAYLQPAFRDRDLMEECALEFKQLAWDQKLITTVVYREGGVNYVVLNLQEKPQADKSVNHYFLKKGYAKINSKLALPEAFDSWKQVEDAAKDKKIGIWMQDEEEEDDE